MAEGDVPTWLRGKTVLELKAFEFGGRVLIPEAFRSIGADGTEKRVPCAVKVITEQERALARIDAIRHVGLLRKWRTDVSTWTVEQAQQAVGPDVFENLDTFAIVARCVVEAEPPHGPAYMLDIMLASFLPSTLFDLFERIDMYSKIFNPRLGELTDAEFWGAVEGIARVRNVSPLAAMRGFAQSDCITRMAVELSRFLRPSSSLPSTETSTPAS